MTAVASNPFERRNWSPTMAQRVTRENVHKYGAAARRFYWAQSQWDGNTAVSEDMRQQIEAAVNAGRVTQCPPALAFGIGRYDDLPGGAR